MKCMYCGNIESKVIDSRATDEDTRIRRRRECLACGKRFTTYEVIENVTVLVVKSGGARQPFDSAKIRNGVIKACEKRPVSSAVIDNLVRDIEKQVYNTLDQEISSSVIGELVMNGLKEIDQVAYIRFASVYRQFRDVTTFIEFVGDLEKMIKDKSLKGNNE